MQPDLRPSASDAKANGAPSAKREALMGSSRSLAQWGPWQRLAISVWAIVLLAICIRGLLHARTHSVYPIFATAARNFLAGVDLYGGPGDPYRYSPLVAVFLVPFSLWSDQIGGMLWRVLNAAVYLSAFAWWCRVGLPRSLTASQPAILCLLIIPLSVGSLNNAQSNPLVLGLLLAGVVAVSLGRWNVASGCLALACLFKVYPIAVGLLLAVVYPRRFAGRFLIALTIGLALPFLLKPFPYILEQYAGWFHHLQRGDRHHLPAELWYRDLRLLCHSCHVLLSPRAYWIIQLLVAAAIATVCIAGRLACWQQRRLLTMLLGLACCWMTLLGPATESSTYMLLAPTLAWALLNAWGQPYPLWLRTSVGASYCLFTAAQAAVWFPGGRQFHALGVQPLAALLLFLCFISMELQRSLSNKANRISSEYSPPAQAA